MTDKMVWKTPNNAVWKMICAQEKALIAEVDSIRISKKPEVIGALFEDSFRNFLRHLMPSSLSVVPGFIVDQKGKESSHFDAVIVDNNFPFLSSIGPHRYVMSPSVVGVIELTTRLDNNKISSILRKDSEVRRISRQMYKEHTWGRILFSAIAVDSIVPVERILKSFAKHSPICQLYTLRPPAQSKAAIHCWMEGASEKDLDASVRYTQSPLADLISDQLQHSIYTLSERVRDPNAVGRALNDYIDFGTVGVQILQSRGRK